MTSNPTVDHVAIAVPSIEHAIPLFRDALGGEFLCGGDNDETGIRLVHLRLPGLKLELMQPLRPDSFLQRHLEKRGPGLHHLTFLVDDVALTVGAMLQFVETTRRWDVPAPNCTLDDVLAGRVVWQDYGPCLREEARSPGDGIQPMGEPIHSMDREPGNNTISPVALLRSRRQTELLAIILGDPGSEFPLSALAKRLSIPYSSAHREIHRAEQFGVVTTRRFQNLRLVRANLASPYYESLATLLGKAER
jgi:methylmalonyl-CoA/ethylmalonyl-CoA epimerase